MKTYQVHVTVLYKLGEVLDELRFKIDADNISDALKEGKEYAEQAFNSGKPFYKRVRPRIKVEEI